MNSAEGILTLSCYPPAHRLAWNDFVRQSRNGTFLLEREYMEYHADRFADHSLLFYKNSRLIALLPAHIEGRAFCSHHGLTYGGMVLGEETTAQLTLDLFSLLMDYLRKMETINQFIYRPVPAMYHRYPAEEDLYALFRMNGRLIGRKISSVIEPSKAIPFSTLRRRKLKMAQCTELSVIKEDDFTAYWEVLEETLRDKYETHPVHSLNEMIRLQQQFPNNIHLFTVKDNKGQLQAGCVIYETSQVAHVQYIASTPDGRTQGAVDFLFDYLIHIYYKEKSYFDLGTSVEEGGKILNEGLIFQKEGFGGRALVYDTYEIPIY